MRVFIKFYFLLAFVPLSLTHANDTLISTESLWKYLDDGSDQQMAWKEINFDDATWQTGNAKLGFGDSNYITTINNHQLPSQTGSATWYFRKQFTVVDPSIYNRISYNLLRDDGAIVYLNGLEIGRSNMPYGPISFDDVAKPIVGDKNENHFYSSSLLTNSLIAGTNTIAIEIHQWSFASSDIGFDFELIGNDANLIRGPYLQSQSPQSIVIKWRTFNPVKSRVNWGMQINSLSNSVNDGILKTEHEIKLTGLTPTAKIYYSIGTDTEIYAGNSEDYHFIMPPVHGSSLPFRMWVIGDSGTGNDNAQAVKDAYLQHNQGNATNLWIMLGDNAYNIGTDKQYQTAVFDMYPELLKKSTLWPTIGNHDSASANSITQSGVYYETFTLPTQAFSDGISTGADSATEAYYSFDYANVHFIVLESNQANTTFRSGMIDWLNNDLLLAQADWLIALWHHPPYTKGTHDSDTESKLIYMRENILQILEEKGVDLILGGHSHAYERSWLIDGHYGVSDTFLANTHLIDSSDGNPINGGAYYKQMLGKDPHQGTVYVVAGSSGKTGNTTGEAHEAMRNLQPLLQLGSLIIDVDDHVMDVRFLNSYSQVQDSFRIIKGDIIFENSFE